MSGAGGADAADSLRRAAAYFRRRGFARALKAVWRKYVSLGRIGGQAVLGAASEEECEALNAFFGRYYRAGERVSIPLELFDRELRESAFGIGLLELHLALEGKPLLTRSERQAGEDRQWRRMFAEVRAEVRAEAIAGPEERAGADAEELPDSEVRAEVHAEAEVRTDAKAGTDSEASAGAKAGVRAGELHVSASRWLDEMERGLGPGMRTLRECYKADPAAAQAALAATARALVLLFGAGGRRLAAPIRLPVLAARVSGDAHALDPDRPAGRLLIAALRRELGMDAATGTEPAAEGGVMPGEPGTRAADGRAGADEPDASAAWTAGGDSDAAVERSEADDADADAAADPDAYGGDGSESLRLRELYRRAGILDDDLSSIVHWFVPLPGHPVLPTVWTLRQVEAESRFPRCSQIYVVENPAVFSTILDSLGSVEAGADDPSALVCTSGPASAAAIRWLQRCLEVSPASCRLYYSGDFDVKGLAMGQTLQRLFPERFTPWRFDSDAYEEASLLPCPGPPLDSAELDRLAKMRLSWDERLCELMRQMGRKVHQEALLDRLLEDFVAEPSENGIMAYPIPPEQRDKAHEEMRDFIKRYSI